MAGLNKHVLPCGKYRGWYIDKMGRMNFFVGTGSIKETLEIAKKLERGGARSASLILTAIKRERHPGKS